MQNLRSFAHSGTQRVPWHATSALAHQRPPQRQPGCLLTPHNMGRNTAVLNLRCATLQREPGSHSQCSPSPPDPQTFTYTVLCRLQVSASCFPRTATPQEYPPSPLPQRDVSTALLQHKQKLVHNPESNTYHLPTQNTTLCPSTESIRQPRKLAVYPSL